MRPVDGIAVGGHVDSPELTLDAEGAFLGLGVLLLALAFVPVRPVVRVLGLVVSVVLVVAAAVVAQVGIPWYFGSHLGFDDGAGG
ncbi:hypothetical protein BH09ACT7_BH09ACT7_54010 [soil metagenome]